MLIRLVQENAEETFLKGLQDNHKSARSRATLLCCFSLISKRIKPDIMLFAVKDVLKDLEGILYFCRNGDVAVTWQGNFLNTKPLLIAAIKQKLGPVIHTIPEHKIFQCFEPDAKIDDLRIMFASKLKEAQTIEQNDALVFEAPPPVVKKTEAFFTDEQLADLKKGIKERNSKRGLEAFGTSILIVEDQDFSRKLLHDLLARQFIYTCHVAKDGTEAINLYAAHAPDIVFLDIELPDINGHDVAALFKKHDERSFVTMVTSNIFIKDVDIAKKNRVDGFIAKPYSKQKIQEAIDTYVKVQHR